MNFSPRLIFFVTLAAWIGSGFGNGTIHLTNMIPAGWIPTATAWIAFFNFCALGFLTYATGYAGIGKGPMAGAPTIAEANTVKAQAIQAQKQPAPPNIS